MAFFTIRERAELDKSADTGKGKIHEFAPRAVTSQRPACTPLPSPPEHDLAGIAGPLQRETETSLKEIDDLIVELRAQRDKLLHESARVQRDIVEYANLSRSTMQATKIIAESLVGWSKKTSNNQQGEGGGKLSHGVREDIGELGSRADVTEARDPT
jgi:hypothetical protein